VFDDIGQAIRVINAPDRYNRIDKTEMSGVPVTVIEYTVF